MIVQGGILMGNWIQKVHPKEGALHRQMGIPHGVIIPKHELLKIERTPIGGRYDGKGKHVTRLLKQRVSFTLNTRR